jgi:hypothetical protein
MVASGEILFVDRDGNALIAVSDCRNADPNEEYPPMGYSLYKVSSTGEMLWGDDGIDLSNGIAYSLVANMSMTQIEDGSYVCAWEIIQNIDTNTTYVWVQMQKISQNGELLWGEEGISVETHTVITEYPYLVSAGNNQVILIYSKGAAQHILARKIDFDGSNAWAEDLAIYRGGFTIPPLWVIIRVIPDQMGGAFVGWYDDRDWTNYENTFIAHVTADGKHGFASGEGGERIGYNDLLRSFGPEMYFNKEEMALYVAFRETSMGQSYQQMTAQKLKIPSGELMWEPDGLEIGPLDDYSISFYTIEGDGRGNAAVFYISSKWDEEYYYGWDICNVTLLDVKGRYMWEDSIKQFANFPGAKGDLASTPAINSTFWFTAWGDERATQNYPIQPPYIRKVYMQRINIDGTLGGTGTGIIDTTSIKMNNMPETSFAAYPNLVNGPVNFHINTENTAKADLSLFSIMGQKVETIFSGVLQNGENVIPWNSQRTSLSKGIYIVTLTTNTGKKSLRIVVN